MKDIDRFMRKVDQSAASECWLWIGATRPNGYGNFLLGGRTTGAHRAAWSLLKGEIPTGMQVCHRCDTPSCVNPEHLFLGTQQDNLNDMGAKGRRVVAPHDGSNNPMFGRRHSHEARQAQSIRARARMGSLHNRATIDEVMARAIKDFCARGAGSTEVAAQLGVSIHVVRGIRSGKNWRHI